MERNIVRSVVMPSISDLTDKEHYAVGVDGELVNALGTTVYGIVRSGEEANKPSEVVVGGEFEAYVKGDGTAISAGNFLTGFTGGVLVKATAGTHYSNIIAMEAASSASALIKVKLL